VRNFFDAGRYITWASERGLGPANLEFVGPQMALAYQLNAISQGPKNSPFQGPTPSRFLIAAKMEIYPVKFEFTLCTKGTKHIFIHQFFPILQLDEHYSHNNSKHDLRYIHIL